jgi:hypothetical protein
LKVTRLNYQLRSCPDCRQPVPPHAKKCPSCGAYQSWWRYVSVGQTNLALLVALFSVLTTLATVGLPMLHKKSSDISVLLDSASADEAVFIARNDGRSGGVLHMGRFVIKINKSGVDVFFPLNDSQRSFIEAGKEQRIAIKYENKGNDRTLCDYLFDQRFFEDFGRITALNVNSSNPVGEHMNDRYSRMSASLACTIVGGQKSFYSSPDEDEDNITIATPCSDILWVRSCLARANSSFAD